MLEKQYIAIILVMVFSGKLITVDADFFSFIVDANQVVLLNPVCEKKKSNFKETGINVKTSSPVQILKLARTCSNNYHFIVEKEIPDVRHSNYKGFLYTTDLIIDIHFRKLYPPPKNLIAT